MARPATALDGAAGAAPRRVALTPWWRGLAARERGMLLLMLAALLATAGWLLWLQPLLALRSHWQAELPRLQAQAQALAPLLQARQQQQRRHTPTLAGLRAQLAAQGLAAQIRIEARGGQWHLQVQELPADALWNWLLPLLADPAVVLQQLQLQRTGDADMPAARVSGSVVIGCQASGGCP